MVVGACIARPCFEGMTQTAKIICNLKGGINEKNNNISGIIPNIPNNIFPTTKLFQLVHNSRGNAKFICNIYSFYRFVL